ncbi:MAG TPA: FHA domain-containing protein [Polyangiaceae bacterium]
MSVFRFQIRQPSGQVDQLLIESERVLIGSGAHCEIRLPLDQAAVEHAVVQAGSGGVFVQALSFQPPPTLNNVPFTQAPLAPGAVLGVGQFQITAELAEGAQGAVVKKKQAGSSPLTLVGVIVVAIGGYFLAFGDEAQTQAAAPRDPPELFGAVIDQCPQRAPDQALALAKERNIVADAKRERRPFHVQDGIASVPIYELASACYKVAGDAPDATDTAAAAASLRRELNEDYRTHRVRLEHNLQIEDRESSRREVRILLQFTEGKQGDYVTWLSNLERELRLKLGRAT